MSGHDDVLRTSAFNVRRLRWLRRQWLADRKLTARHRLTGDELIRVSFGPSGERYLHTPVNRLEPRRQKSLAPSSCSKREREVDRERGEKEKREPPRVHAAVPTCPLFCFLGISSAAHDATFLFYESIVVCLLLCV